MKGLHWPYRIGLILNVRFLEVGISLFNDKTPTGLYISKENSEC